MTEKIKSFEEFCKLNDKYLHFEKPSSKYINGRIAISATAKLLQDNPAKFSNEKITELEKGLSEFNSTLEELSKKEIKEIEEKIDKWLVALISRVFEYNETDVKEEYLKEVKEKVYQFLNETQAGLNAEVVYYLVKFFFIEK